MDSRVLKTGSPDAYDKTTVGGGSGVNFVYPTYDAAGNMIQTLSNSPTGTTRIHLTYDAWNRLVAVKTVEDSGASTIQTAEFDGLAVKPQ